MMIQEPTQWCSNNWRMMHGREKHSRFWTRHMDVLWKTKPRLVVEEISRLVVEEISRLKEEEGRSNTDFELRTTASKNVIGRMSQEELNELQEAAKDMEQNGHSEDHKRR